MADVISANHIPTHSVIIAADTSVKTIKKEKVFLTHSRNLFSVQNAQKRIKKQLIRKQKFAILK